MPKYKITTLGCKVNRAESDQIAAAMRSACWQPAGKRQDADVCIINTCTVTRKASMQSRQAIRKAMRANPNARILVTGCYAQTEPETVSRIVGAGGLVRRGDQTDIAAMLCDVIGSDCGPVETAAEISGKLPAGGSSESASVAERTRPFLKVQDGCDAFCTYCIVPHARGRSRSLPPGEVLESLRMLAGAGFHEAVLAGIHLGCYGRDLHPAASLFDLLRRIDAERPIRRLRLSSIEPLELTWTKVELTAASDCICPHLHIPVQSGDDDVLDRMGRPYTARQFEELVLAIHRRMPEAAIGADVLVGFPAENGPAFERTYQLAERLPLSYLHVFPFSPRPGTPAAAMPDQIPAGVVKERSARMRRLGEQLRRAFRRRFLHRRLEVLVETSRDRHSGMLKGLTANYLPVLIDAGDVHRNTMAEITVTGVEGKYLTGRLNQTKQQGKESNGEPQIRLQGRHRSTDRRV